MASRQISIWLLVVMGVFVSCTRVEVAPPSPPLALDDGGEGGQPGGGAGSVPGRGGDSSGGDGPENGGQPGALELGLWPTFAAEPVRSADVQAVAAAVSALSLGAKTLPLSERWDTLSGTTGSPRSATWNRLDAMVEPYRQRRGKVALCIGIVDRTLPAWPFAGGLESEAAGAAMRRTIDEVYGRYGDLLSHLCIGYEVDRYLAQASAEERAQLLAFLQQTVDYASEHPLRRSGGVAIGVAISLSALTEDAEAPLPELMLGDEVVGVYDPLDENAEPKPASSVAEELADAFETLASAAPVPLPLSLFEVGYPSATAVGSSEGAQRTFYEALFGAVDAARDQLSFVGVLGLADRAAAECEAEALLFGGSAASVEARAIARCSMGLRAENDKAAWTTVLGAVSRYR